MANTFLVQRFTGLGFTIVRDIKANLNRTGSKASGDLIQGVGFDVVEVGTTVTLIGRVKGPGGEYWDFVDEGRKPGKATPINAIVDWIKTKGIVPEGNTTVEQFAFLISRKHKREGIKATNAFSDVLNSLRISVIDDAVFADLEAQIDELVFEFKKQG